MNWYAMLQTCHCRYNTQLYNSPQLTDEQIQKSNSNLKANHKFQSLDEGETTAGRHGKTGPEGSFFTVGMGMSCSCCAHRRGWVLQWSAAAPDRGRSFSSSRSTRNYVRRQGDAGSPDAEAVVQWSRAQCQR